MTVEIFNPQLSDFKEDHLRTIAESLMDRRAALVEKQNGYTSRGETLYRMFRAEIEERQKQIESIDEIITQFMGAIQIKEKENQVVSN